MRRVDIHEELTVLDLALKKKAHLSVAETCFSEWMTMARNEVEKRL
jgi:hypothetical protein